MKDKIKVFESLWRNKFIEPEETTLEGLIASLRGAADYLQELKDAGVQMDEDSSDDYYWLRTTDQEVATKFSFNEEEDFDDDCEDDEDDECDEDESNE